MRTLPLVLLLLAACTQSTPNPPTLAEIQWSNSAGLLTLRPDYTYKIAAPKDHPSASPQVGHYDILSAQYGILMLDNRTAIHLIFEAESPTRVLARNTYPYSYVPITLTPSAAVPPAQRDHYIHIADQYYALDTLLIIPNTNPVAPLLPH